MDLEDALLYSSVVAMVIGCYLGTLKMLHRCKWTNLSCCGIVINRDVAIERDIEHGELRRVSSGIPILTQIFPNRGITI